MLVTSTFSESVAIGKAFALGRRAASAGESHSTLRLGLLALTKGSRGGALAILPALSDDLAIRPYF